MLASGINKIYHKAFVVEEDDVRRIQGTIEKGMSGLREDSHVVFRVERQDDRFYETTNLTDVLSDPNATKRKITLLSVELRRKNENLPPYKSDQIVVVYFACSPYFGQVDTVVIKITSEDRNWALLLADELEPQVKRTFRAKSIPRWLIGLLLSLLSFLILQPISLSSLHEVTRLIFQAGFLTFLCFGGTYFVDRLLFTLRPLPLVNRISNLIGPESGFIWGEEGEKYQERERTRQNLYWAVVVGFIISIAANFVFALMTNAF